MNTSLAARIAANVTLAAASWAGVSTVKSDHIRNIRAIAVATHNTCAACGEALSGTLEAAHIVSCDYGNGMTSKEAYGKGFADYNIYIGHKSCNDYDRVSCKGDPFAIVASMVRPDLIIGKMPTRGEAARMVADLADASDADAIRRAAARDAVRSR